MMEDLEAAKAAALEKVRGITREREEAMNAAKAAVYARFRVREQIANDEYQDAVRAVREAMNAEPDHPWTGKRVWQTAYKGRRVIKVWGVVEMMRLDTEWPGIGRGRYRRVNPSLGTPFVRLLRADGKPGLRMDDLHGWKLEGAE